jgi:two-component system response regulator AtoC
MPSILIIDDEQSVTKLFVHHFTARGWDAGMAGTGEAGLQACEKSAPDIILLDMKLPDMDGMEVLKRLNDRKCPASVVIMTGWGSIANAVEAVKLGAEQYLTKPVALLELNALVDRVIETRKLKIENRYYRQREDHPVVGVSMAIQKLHHMIDLMAENADTTTLLLGESGTGKELVAREIHRRSRRSERPFLDINCSSLPETLLESEMFGHERGAFTDAREMKRGLLEVADGGTVFLDEIGEMPLAVQPKLLRVLETRSFKRVGGTREIQVNVRIIAATNRDLAKAAADGRFREDLYYRLKVFPVSIPPLRERPEDVPALAEYFLQEFNAALKKSITGFTSEATDLLRGYSWPGNVRELKNLVERAVVLSKSPLIGTDMLPPEISGAGTTAGLPAPSAPLGDGGTARTLEEVEREHIKAVLGAEGNNRSATARALGISRSTLIEKLKKYEIA